jgi:L-arabonate dehydrase
MSNTTKSSLRSAAWFDRQDRQAYEHRGMMRAHGLPDDAFSGKPIIAICSVWSDFSPCDLGLKKLAERAKAGVLAAGGVPLVMPIPAIGEPLMRPTPMMFRNLTSMVVEEWLRANPVDGVLLLAGCDKSTPAMLMGALSVDLPTILISSGPRNSARFRGDSLGAGTSIWSSEQAVAEGRWTKADMVATEEVMASSVGTCNTMGTASTMAAIAEVLGFSLPGNCSLGATDARRAKLAERSGRQIIQAVLSEQKPSQFLTKASFANAIRVVAALGGSTNAIPHLLAIASRAQIPLSLDDWDSLGWDVPCIANIQPSGHALMQDFDDAGGLGVVMARLLAAGLLDGDAGSSSGETLASRYKEARCWNDDIIHPLDCPVSPQGGIVVLRGNLCPDGAVLKPSAATAALMQHEGRAHVFDTIEEWHAAASNPDLDVKADDILVLRNSGITGYPGMPEVGNIRIPDKLAREGVKDMVRISDARMSGTAYGTVVLHIAPESAKGGPLSLVRNGDRIRLDVAGRRLDMLVSEEELSARHMAQEDVSEGLNQSGYLTLFHTHVMQPDKGADFDFLQGRRGAYIPRDMT